MRHRLRLEANTHRRMGDEDMNFKLIGTGIAALSLLATSFSAEAADIPRPVYKGVRSVVAYYNWTGFYVGVQGGYGWGTSNWDYAFTPATGPVNNRPKGWLFGGTLGYNYQVGSIVYGIEGDFSWSNVKDSVACGGFSCETESRWFTTLRGRLGYAIDRWLPYIHGGLAYGDVNASSTNPLFPGTSSRQVGWTLGAGVEYAFTGNWTAKLEYLYVDLGRFDCSISCGVPGPVNVSFKEHIARVGLNYKFSGPVFSRY
jgi:outer membrane immunogenic protein